MAKNKIASPDSEFNKLDVFDRIRCLEVLDGRFMFTLQVTVSYVVEEYKAKGITIDYTELYAELKQFGDYAKSVDSKEEEDKNTHP